MLWQLTFGKNHPQQLSASTTVEAHNWFEALQAVLKSKGIRARPISKLKCDRQKDGSFVVTDPITEARYFIRPVNAQEPAPTIGDLASGTNNGEGEKDTHVFFSRDETPKDGSNIFYRERLISVRGGTSRERASEIVRNCYEELRSQGSPENAKMFISVQVYDHEFGQNALRPAIAALTWKEWNPVKLKILFPLSGDHGVIFSTLPPTPSENAAVEPQLLSAASVAEEMVTVEAAISPSPEVTAEEKAQATVSPQIDLSSRMIDAFEQMQGIFEIRDHDEAAAFTLNLARSLVGCESGCCLLMKPQKDLLYVSAAEGPITEKIMGRERSLFGGIIGFVVRMGAVVNINDPAKETYFDETMDKISGYNIVNRLCAPIQYEGHLQGILELVNSPRVGGFTTADADILSYLAGSLAEYFSNSLAPRHA